MARLSLFTILAVCVVFTYAQVGEKEFRREIRKLQRQIDDMNGGGGGGKWSSLCIHCIKKNKKHSENADTSTSVTFDLDV